MQCEYSTDIVFKKHEDLKSLYEQLTEKTIHSLKPYNIVTFFGMKIKDNKKVKQEMIACKNRR